jgi:hypothetical protein
MPDTTLTVSENQRYLAHADGSPFFFLGDTAWELFHRLNREEADLYLQDRARKGFTVIQAVVLAELDGLRAPNPYGELPLHDFDPTRPNEAYFRHVDYIVDKAASLGMYVGMLPTWGDKYNAGWGKGPEIFTPENARPYGEYLGRRYADKPIIWILGGDRALVTWDHVNVIRQMAAGIRAAVGNRQLITFHPQGQQTSSAYFHCDEWLNFNMYQTGHRFDRDNWRSIAQDYARTPTKPCLDAEPGYEDHPNGWKPDTGWLDAYECRKFLYWALFAGACGHTYGCHDIWQMWEPGRDPVSAARTPWREALNLPGAGQMHIAKDLLLARPYLTRIPDQGLLASDALTGTEHIQATRDKEGRFALVYSAAGKPFTLRMEKIGGPAEGATYHAAWVDPRTGNVQDTGTVTATGEREFTPPTSGRENDWVLTLDAAAA